jgi:hypothetical protein
MGRLVEGGGKTARCATFVTTGARWPSASRADGEMEEVRVMGGAEKAAERPETPQV